MLVILSNIAISTTNNSIHILVSRTVQGGLTFMEWDC